LGRGFEDGILTLSECTSSICSRHRWFSWSAPASTAASVVAWVVVRHRYCRKDLLTLSHGDNNRHWTALSFSSSIRFAIVISNKIRAMDGRNSVQSMERP
jgi:hypothetical protein